MLTRRALRAWCLVHKWSSLVCTVFLLLLCLTGLPLVFHDEIDELLGNEAEPPAMAANAPRASLDRLLEAGRARRPGEVVQFFVWDDDQPDVVIVNLAKSADAPPADVHQVVIDARTAQVLMEPDFRASFTGIMLILHTEMFAGQAGKLFLGAMGLLFVAAIVSGVVLYAPFMRRLAFGTVRKDRARRTRWLDLHNLLGIVTVAWALVVGVTGVVNTLADQLLNVWRGDQLADMVAPYRGMSAPETLVSLDRAMATARAAAPGMTPRFVAFPGTRFTSNHHYMVAMCGATPLTKRLIQPVLVDAATGALTDTRALPWYITSLLVSQPLHFGDYGGLPLKVIWGLLDLVTIVVLGSGLYLWLARRSTSIEVRVAELTREDVMADARR